MIVMVFRSRLSPEAGEDYLRMAERMERLVAAQPGFISFKGFTAPDGERVAIAEFASEEDVVAWRDHPEHQEARRLGRAQFYDAYRLQVCRSIRESTFRREGTPEP